ncbi:sugar phosphate isomerase/epimerase [Candidatus Aerophobetes bacterium]|nr:sugar phosphate isomerase/epimerase [Candidatus Aerophobetes bacterium]
MKISLCSIKYTDEKIEDVVRKVSHLGYDGIEIVIDHIEDYLKRGKELNSLKRLIYSYELKVPIIAPHFNFTGSEEERERSVENALRFIEYAEALDCPLIRVFTGKVGAKEATKKQWEQCVSSLKEICGVAHRKKITFVLETHPHQLMDTVESTLKLVQRVNSPNLKVLLDIWHLFNEGKADPVEALNRLFPYIMHVHAKNMIRKPQENQIAYFEDGDMEYPIFLEALKKSGYNRYISVEWFGGNPWEAAKHELKYLRQFFPKS